MKPYVFNNKFYLIDFLTVILPNTTPVKLNKAMYFLWAYYSASWGDLNDSDYPGYLFPPRFKALKYGPVDFDLYNKYQNNQKYFNQLKNCYFNLDQSESTIENNNAWIDVKDMLFDIIDQISKINDYDLCIRSMQDDVWQHAYDSGFYWIMPQDIRNNYFKLVEFEKENNNEE